jgi:cytochrome c-type biogenesis protein
MLHATSPHSETKEKAQEFIAHNKYTFPVYYDLDDNIYGLGIRGYPTTYFLDENGYITNVVTGAMSKNSLYAAVEELLN